MENEISTNSSSKYPSRESPLDRVRFLKTPDNLEDLKDGRTSPFRATIKKSQSLSMFYKLTDSVPSTAETTPRTTPVAGPTKK